MKILLAIDGSSHTHRMLAHLAAHEELLGAAREFTMLTVVPPVPVHAARFLDRQTLDGHYAEQAESVFKPVQAFADQQRWNIHPQHVVGHASEAIAAFATDHKFDLIVMGTHGHSSLGNVVLGSVVTGVLARCKVPVLLVR